MISEACRYAIKAMIFINSQKATEKKVRLTEIARAISSPQAFTAKILQQLSKAHLLKSAIGAHGGYWIPSEKRITLKSIIEIIDGKELFNRCVLGLDMCSSSKPCPVHHQYKLIRDDLQNMLTQSYLDDYTDDLKSKKIKLK